MKLYLDDLRPCPEGWTPVKTAGEAISVLSSGGIEEISLDHDLGEPEDAVGNGYQVVCWIEEQAYAGNWQIVPKVILIHSANPVGMLKMKQAIEFIESLRNKENNPCR